MHLYQHNFMYRLGTAGLSLVVAAFAVGGVGLSSDGRSSLIGGLGAIPAPEPWTMPPVTGPPTMPPPSTIQSPQKEQPPNEAAPQYHPPAPEPVRARPPAKTPKEAVAAAVSVGHSRGVRVGVAVLDRSTGAFYGAGAYQGQFASASVMKVFIATRLLAEGRANDTAIRNQMWQMIVASDDNAARTLYRLVGTESLIPWVANRYGIGGLAPANVPNYWGLTRITAQATVNFYAAVARDPAVGPWLLNAMANATTVAADGFRQDFGLPSVAKGWRVKQGWMCCLEGLTRMHSTGYVNGDRYVVAMLTEGSTGVYGNYGAQTLTLMARALLPGGTFPRSAPAPTTPRPTTTAPPPTTSAPPPTTTAPPPTTTAPPQTTEPPSASRERRGSPR